MREAEGERERARESEGERDNFIYDSLRQLISRAELRLAVTYVINLGI